MTLEFTLNHDAPATADFDCIVVGAFADKTLTPAAQAIDKACAGRLTVLAERGDAQAAQRASEALKQALAARK